MAEEVPAPPPSYFRAIFFMSSHWSGCLALATAAAAQQKGSTIRSLPAATRTTQQQSVRTQCTYSPYNRASDNDNGAVQSDTEETGSLAYLRTGLERTRCSVEWCTMKAAAVWHIWGSTPYDPPFAGGLPNNTYTSSQQRVGGELVHHRRLAFCALCLCLFVMQQQRTTTTQQDLPPFPLKAANRPPSVMGICQKPWAYTA